MSQAVKIELTEKANALLRTVKEMPSWAMDAVCLGMDRANEAVLENIISKHLKGKGPFPPEQHRLGVDSARLWQAAWYSPAVASGTTASSSIGDNVAYAALHEFGGTIHHKARTGTARLRTDAHGNLLRQQANANLAIFAGKQHKASRVKEVAYKAEAYDVEMPARAPFRTGIEEMLEQYGKMVSREIVGAWDKHAA
jgi:hypothetical protein